MYGDPHPLKFRIELCSLLHAWAFTVSTFQGNLVLIDRTVSEKNASDKLTDNRLMVLFHTTPQKVRGKDFFSIFQSYMYCTYIGWGKTGSIITLLISVFSWARFPVVNRNTRDNPRLESLNKAIDSVQLPFYTSLLPSDNCSSDKTETLIQNQGNKKQ